MKKQIFQFPIYNIMRSCVLFTLIFFSCSKEDDPVVEESLNMFKGTSWVANDDIAQFIYGGNATTTIEFLTETDCQEVNVNGSGTFVNEGTYTYKDDSVSWTIKEITISGKASGSVLSTNMGTMAGGNRIYNKKSS